MRALRKEAVTEVNVPDAPSKSLASAQSLSKAMKLQILHASRSPSDEIIIAFKGRTAMSQYMPNEPHKWGLKAWCLADSKSGYMYNVNMYTGKEQWLSTKREVPHNSKLTAGHFSA